MKNKKLAATLVLIAGLSFNSSAAASTVWTDWTSLTIGDPGGFAEGTLNSIGVTWSGEVTGNSVINGNSSIWNPEATYVGGNIAESPDAVGDHIGLDGSLGTTTITFSQTVSNPIIAIWSLGQPGVAATITFDQIPTFQVGGPNSSYGGSAITVNGNTVSGNEGNGIITFIGNYDSISFTNTDENWYAMSVGMTTVPLPASVWMLLSAGAALVGFGRRSF